MTHRITEEIDWKDGINQFRLRVMEDMIQLKKEIEELKQQVKGETP